MALDLKEAASQEALDFAQSLHGRGKDTMTVDKMDESCIL